MSLMSFKKDGPQTGSSTSRYSTNPYDEREEDIEAHIEEFQEKFPEEIRCDMVEVSPPDVKYSAKAYWKQGGDQYMRVSESAFEKGEWFVRSVILHEMVHLFFYQNDQRDIPDGDTVFEWMLGRVGAIPSGVSEQSEEWELCELFLEDGLRSE